MTPAPAPTPAETLKLLPESTPALRFVYISALFAGMKIMTPRITSNFYSKHQTPIRQFVKKGPKNYKIYHTGIQSRR